MKEEIIEQINIVLRQVSQQGQAQDSIGLLESANKLATLRYNLGDIWVQAKEKADAAEHSYKYKVDTLFLSLREEGKTIDEARALARKEYVNDYDRVLKLESEKNRAAQIRDDLAQRISLLQSYCSELRSQKNYNEM